MARTMMTFGVMPTQREFAKSWDKKIAPGKYNYELRGSDAATARAAKVPTAGEFGEKQLYGIVKKLRNAFNRGDDNAGSLASSILGTLDFDWV